MEGGLRESLADLQSLRYVRFRISNRAHIKIQVVDQHSAVREGKDMMYLIADHSDLNKFSGHDDPNFKLVYPVIVEMAKNASQTARQNYEGRRSYR